MIDLKETIAFAVDYACEAVRQHLSAQQHEREWWKTYRAALTGCLAYTPRSDEESVHADTTSTVEGCVRAARVAADISHGPLKQEAQPTAAGE